MTPRAFKFWYLAIFSRSSCSTWLACAALLRASIFRRLARWLALRASLNRLVVTLTVTTPASASTANSARLQRRFSRSFFVIAAMLLHRTDQSERQTRYVSLGGGRVGAALDGLAR